MAKLSDITTTWAREATRAYNSGQYGECEECLQEVALSHTGTFSRLRWSVESNQLACRIQGAVATSRQEQLEGICSSYELLWEKARGLPPNADSIQTEVAIVCAMCQLVVMLQSHCRTATRFTSEWSIQHCNALIGRICSYFGMEESHIAQALPVVVESLKDSSVNGDVFAVKAILNLMFSRAVMHLLHAEQEDAVKIFSSIWAALNRQTELVCGQGLFNTAIKTKRLVEETLSIGDEVISLEREHKYSEAWQLFSEEDYQPALETLYSLLQTSSLPHLTASVARLLAGGCYVSMHKPNLALCSYQQCLRSSSNVAVLPALHNCATVYKTMGNAEAEMGMRKILLEALKLQEEQKETAPEREKPFSGVMLWAGGLRGEKVSLHPGLTSRLELLEATYTAAYRAMQLCRYKESAVLFMEIISVLENGSKALPPSLPSPSALYLLAIRALLCDADYEQAQLLCSKLVDVFLPGVKSCLSSSPSSSQANMTATLSHALVLAQAFYFRAFATVQVNKFQESRAYCERCLNLVKFMLPRLIGGDQTKMLNCAKTLQARALNHLAVLSIGQRKNTQALRLLAEALASSAPTPKPANDGDLSPEMEPDRDADTSSKKLDPLSGSDGSSSSDQCLVFNHYLLQCKLGRVADAARGWLEERGRLPDTVQKGRQGLTEAKRTLAKLKHEGKDRYLAEMDAAMLGRWLRYASK